MEIAMDEKEKRILDYLYQDGFATNRQIVEYLEKIGQSGGSIQNVRNALRSLTDHKIVEHKELRDNKEHVHFLSERGLEILGLEKSAVSAFQKRLARIRVSHLRHYWLVRALEDSLHKNVEQGGCYTIESVNEFNDERSVLCVNLKDQANIRSDGEIRIFQSGFERLAFRVEMDTGTESLSSQVKTKFNTYHLYFQSERINTEYQTWPLYVLFVTPQARIESILQKFGKHDFLPYLIFLPLEHLEPFPVDSKWQKYLDEKKVISEFRKEVRHEGHLISDQEVVEVLEPGKTWCIRDPVNQVEYTARYETKNKKEYIMLQERTNLFTAPVLTRGDAQKFSLESLVEDRLPLLTFYNAVKEAGEKQHDYELIVRTVYSMPSKDPFFPMLLDIKGRQELWQPHGYLKIRKPFPDNLVRDVLFMLVFSAENVSDLQLLKYDAFLSAKPYLSKLATLPVYYGCLILAKDEEQAKKLWESLRDLPILKRSRIILLCDCVPEKVFHAPVWLTETGEKLSLFKPQTAEPVKSASQ